jgi:DNA-binding IclR family transcriptional regulator
MRSQADVEGEPPVRSPMPSVDKALRALLELAEAGNRGLSLGALADRLDMNRSSLHVTLGALHHRRFVDKNATTGNYVLGVSLIAAADLYHRNFDLRGTLRPILDRLADQLNEVVYLGVLEGTDLLYIARVESRRPIQPATSVGIRVPALTTAMGRALISAQYDDFESFAQRFEGTLHPHTPKAPRTLQAEWKEIQAAQRVGHALDVENSVEGLCAVAVAIQFNGLPAAAASIVMLADDFYREGEAYYAEPLFASLRAGLRPPLTVFLDGADR